MYIIENLDMLSSLESLIEKLQKEHITFYLKKIERDSDSEWYCVDECDIKDIWIKDEVILAIYSCELGNNFYDYGEEEPEEFDWSEVTEELANDIQNYCDCGLIDIISCSDCCGCEGW